MRKLVYYPTRVVVDVSNLTTWEDVHTAVLDQISDDVNWGLYDNRTNWPYYLSDNSTSQPPQALQLLTLVIPHSKYTVCQLGVYQTKK